ncbi:MAG TPA: hypothetical protein PLV50_01385 [Smithella sp.]|nr:hypothetical protein [Smithella sp.]MDM7987908.1 hypothetical protein [Smithella sp.]HNY50593.1 hypothetical protein [Smithella sp.]HOG89160.1 hypothetical protein [Smithella sp.]HOU51702.1 hypothetical protein [Smithella sp.]
MKSIYLLCADGIVIDRRTNNVSLFNVVEEINSVGFPLLINKLYAICLMNREVHDEDMTDAHFEFKLDNKVLLKANTSINFQQKQRTRVVLEVSGLVIPVPGTLKVSLLRDGEVIACNEIEIHKIDKTSTVSKTIN